MGINDHFCRQVSFSLKKKKKSYYILLNVTIIKKTCDIPGVCTKHTYQRVSVVNPTVLASTSSIDPLLEKISEAKKNLISSSPAEDVLFC